MGIAELSSSRLLLKKPGPDDVEALVEQIGDWEVAKWLAKVPYPYTQDDANDWLTSGLQSELSFNTYLDERLIGGVGLAPNTDGSYELGYWLGKDYWGRGFATEAARCLLDYAMNELDLTPIQSGYMIGNEQSGKVLKKLGFREVGEIEIYSISRGESVPSIRLLLA